MKTAKKFQMPYITQKDRHTTIQILTKLISLESCLAINIAYHMIVLKYYAEKKSRKGEVDSMRDKYR
jgi:hypothetical protein